MEVSGCFPACLRKTFILSAHHTTHTKIKNLNCTTIINEIITHNNKKKKDIKRVKMPGHDGKKMGKLRVSESTVCGLGW